MVRLVTLSVTLAYALTVLAAPTPAGSNAVDTSKPGAQNVGKGDGSQFITGQCFSNADCASTCCNKNTGLCNAIGAVGIENCGFQASGAAAAAPAPAATTAASTANAAIDSSKPGAQNVGKGDGSQFITGQCLSNADCASTCCNKNTGLCNAIGAVGIENCGFGAAAAAPAVAAPAATTAASTVNAAIDTSKPGAQNVGKGDGSQFITGQCLSNADCASTCCNKNTGLCNAIGAVGIQNCGFGAAAAAAAPAAAAPAAGTATSTANAAVDSSKPGAQNVGKGDGSQFITGQCFSNADCASTCCNKNTGLCNAIGAVGIQNCGFQAAA
ncbi:hypothetical protein CONLIGDRAFT_673986 [Coniochaeta ligniaria NRRL 30616]|uniref:Biotrophy-associated secreted protein 2 n=1 Tax=Coniochaeta ligniaria NRRL 30616 TaxID=1408157 RepID=A0A1J7I8X9_9PEZI|nr:hypothetical protein CONLIGDRAFT_673986 [Coniochaeta ligniaria NRRL 30616]